MKTGIEKAPSENTLDITLSNLQERVKLLEKSYNPEGLNLHFYNLVRTDPVLFEELYSIGQEAWNIIRVNPSWETSFWFYDYFLLVSRGSYKVLIDHTQANYSKDVVERLALLLVDISQLTTIKEYEGDILIRLSEALANLLLAFHNISDLRNIVRKKAEEMNNQKIVRFVKGTIETVRGIEKKNALAS